MDYQGVWEFVSQSFEILPRKLKKVWEFSQTSGGSILNLSDNLHIYYHCTGKRGGTCKSDLIREEKLDEVFLELIEKLPDPDKGLFEEIKKVSVKLKSNVNLFKKLYEIPLIF